MYTLLIIAALNCGHCGSAATTIPGFTTQQSCIDAVVAMREEIMEATRGYSTLSRRVIVRCIKVD